MNPTEWIHGSYVHQRRSRILAHRLAALLPVGSSVLDVGCGDGLIDRQILAQRPDLVLSGVDVFIRPNALIPVVVFDGQNLPQPDGSVDVVMFIDVLHHTADPTILLREAARVARHAVVIKDHLQEGFLAHACLRFMDRVGNSRHGVALPHNYWPKARWQKAFADLHLEPRSWTEVLRLYPGPLDWCFGRSLHFLARLERPAANSTRGDPAAPAGREDPSGG